MAILKRVKKAILFPTGNLSSFDELGKEIPDLSGTYSIEIHKRIYLEACDDLVFEGFQILPDGFALTALGWAIYFKERGILWDEAKEQFK